MTGRALVQPSCGRIPTSLLFRAVLGSAPADHVTMAWLLAGLHQRSFGMVMLLLGLIAILPGVSVFAGLLLVPLAFQMMMARELPILPRFIGIRSIPTYRVSRLINRSIPVIRALETIIHPRWHTPFVATKRLVGLIVLLLALTLFMPIPFSNVIPGALIMLIAVAYLEEDGILLSIALSASVPSAAITIAEGWVTIVGANFLFRM